MIQLRTTLINAALLLLTGLAGAFLAQWVGIPMPFLLGALASVGFLSALRSAYGASDMAFPSPARRLFVAAIGVMIGASFSADLLASLPMIWPSLLAMVLFVALALGAGTVLFRSLGGMDQVTAFYAAMPGGLIEAVSLGEAAGGNVRQLSLQHFVRIVFVVVIVPTLYLYWSGHAVGSAAGQSFNMGGGTAFDPLYVMILAVIGMWIGPHLRLPAAHLVGPLVLSAALHGSGALHLASPDWLLFIAQLVVGTGLGTTFAGAALRDLWRAMGLGLAYVLAILLLAYVFAAALSHVMPFGFDTLFVSFAPGGVTEMGLVALSLGISPVIVTVHHLLRISLTVFFCGMMVPRFKNGHQTPGS